MSTARILALVVALALGLAVATDDGEPVDSFFEFTTRIQFSPWDQGGKVLDGRIQNQL